MAIQWQTSKVAPTAAELQALTDGLTALGISQMTMTAAELIRGCGLFVAEYISDTKKPSLDRNPLPQQALIPLAHFNEKIRWGAAMFRYFLANPEKWHHEVDLKGDRWWHWAGYIGWFKSYLPQKWWTEPPQDASMSWKDLTAYIIGSQINSGQAAVALWHKLTGKTAQVPEGGQIQANEVAMMTQALNDLNIFPSETGPAWEDGDGSDGEGIGKYWPIAAAAAGLLLMLSGED